MEKKEVKEECVQLLVPVTKRALRVKDEKEGTAETNSHSNSDSDQSAQDKAFEHQRRSTIIPLDVPPLIPSHNKSSSIHKYSGHSRLLNDTAIPSTKMIWKHLYLKMTVAAEEDRITSFCFSTNGGNIGRDLSNVASIPADKLLNKHNHATITYVDGSFYICDCQSGSGTYIRMLCSDSENQRLQWPLSQNCVFRCGKSEFLVESHDKVRQTLQIRAITGKLADCTFTVSSNGADIGRSTENLIHASDGELSRKHARIFYDRDCFYVYDLHSTNGTFMRLVGPYEKPFRLESGDDLLISQTCLTVTHFDYGVHANMGPRKHMEDTHSVIQDLHIDCLTELGYYPQSFFGVFDGHGGSEASSFMKEQLHVTLIDEFRRHQSQFTCAATNDISALVQRQIIAAFERTDRDFLSQSDRPQAGSTGTTVLIAGTQVFVANAGDSRTILSRSGLAVRLSNDHKPSRPDEAQRIRDTGGFVIHGRIMGELAVSRAFGDAAYKLWEEGKDSDAHDILKGSLVICTPEITEFTLSDEEEFLVLASDGLFDVLTDQQVIQFVQGKLDQFGDVQRATEALVQHAIVQERSADNVTAVVVLLRHRTN